MANVLVQHHGLGLEHIGLPQTGGDPRTIHLMPGVNVVAQADWEEAEKSQVVKFKLKHPKRAPMFEVIGRGLEEGKSPLAKMQPDEAKELIQQTFREDLLEDWGRLETRVSVQRAITKQLAALDVQPKKDEE